MALHSIQIDLIRPKRLFKLIHDRSTVALWYRCLCTVDFGLWYVSWILCELTTSFQQFNNNNNDANLNPSVGSVTYYLILRAHSIDVDVDRGARGGIRIDGNADIISKYWICILTLKYKNRIMIIIISDGALYAMGHGASVRSCTYPAFERGMTYSRGIYSFSLRMSPMRFYGGV